MTLEETYESISPSVVALGSMMRRRASTDPAPAFCKIIGTGFVVDPRGIICTNRHVADALQSLPPHPKTGKPTGFAMFVGPLQEYQGQHIRGVFWVDIKNYAILDKIESDSEFYGQNAPDIAFLQIDVCEVPALRLESEENNWSVGRAVATLGYAMGDNALVVYDNRVR